MGIVRAPVPMLRVYTDVEIAGLRIPTRYVPHNLSVHMISVLYDRCGD